MNSVELGEVRNSFKTLEEKYEVIMYGSQVEGGSRPSSDVDIAVITRKVSREENVNIQENLLGILPLKYDIRVFELYPIYIQISIIENYKVVFGDPLEISEYFYHYRKKWDDCKHRILSNQFSSYKERLSLI
ncbi:MAG: nucleotidyltransferase domain-containing protein [Promethearchaeota archaeon]